MPSYSGRASGEFRFLTFGRTRCLPRLTRTLADTAKQADLVARQKVELARITARLDRLLEVFVDGTIGKDEFTAHKEKLTHEKSALAESIANFETKGANRFKPLADFITASRQAKYDAQTEDLAELRNWHKKTGSNLIFAGRNLAEENGERVRRTRLKPRRVRKAFRAIRPA